MTFLIMKFREVFCLWALFLSFTVLHFSGSREVLKWRILVATASVRRTSNVFQNIRDSMLWMFNTPDTKFGQFSLSGNAWFILSLWFLNLNFRLRWFGPEEPPPLVRITFPTLHCYVILICLGVPPPPPHTHS